MCIYDRVANMTFCKWMVEKLKWPCLSLKCVVEMQCRCFNEMCLCIGCKAVWFAYTSNWLTAPIAVRRLFGPCRVGASTQTQILCL